MNATAYSDLKAAWHPEKILAMRRGEQVVPVHLQVDLSSLCNHGCKFCGYRSETGLSSEEFGGLDLRGNFTNNPNRWIDTAKMKEILDDCAALGVKAVQFTGGGEPTVHPDHIEVFAYALDHGLDVALVTNLSRLKEGWRAIFPRFTWIRASIDAGSAASYAAIRDVPDHAYRKVLDHMAIVAQQLNWSGSKCLFGAGYVITQDNWRELVEGIQAIRATGVAYVRLSAVFSIEGSKPYIDIHDQIVERIAEAKKLETDTFKVLNLYGNRIADLDTGSPEFQFCGQQQMTVYLGGNLKLFRCCNTAFQKQGEVGDLTHQSFAEWFKSEEKRIAYADFDARTCRFCQFLGKNRVINGLVGKPEHVNFT